MEDKMAHVMTAEEKRWRAESDARTLVDAEKIRTEKARLGAALKEITRMNKVKEKEIKLAKKVVKTKAGPTKAKAKPAKKMTRRAIRKPMARRAAKRKR